MSLKNHRSLPLDFFLILLSTNLITFAYIRNEYAWADDYSFLGSYIGFSPSLSTEHYTGYRPLLQIIFDLVFTNIQAIEDLRFLRYVALIGTSLLSIAIFRILVLSGWGKWSSIFLACTVQFLPTFQIYQWWATAFIYSWVAVASLISFSLQQKGYWVRSSTILIICFLIYQPAATFGMIGLLVDFLNQRRLRRRHIEYMLSLTITFVLATVLSRFTLYLLQIVPKERAGVISSPDDLAAKIIWLLTRPTILSFRPYFWNSPNLTEIICALILFAVFIFFIFKKMLALRNSVVFFLSLACIFLMMLLPLLPIRENQVEFRVLPSTSVLGLILLVYIVKAYLEKYSNLMRLSPIFASVMISLVALSASNSSEKIFIKPYKSIKTFVFEKTYGDNSEVLYYKIDYSDWPMRNYIGAPSAIYDLQMPWVVEPLLKFMLSDKYSAILPLGDRPRSSNIILNLNELKSLPIEK